MTDTFVVEQHQMALAYDQSPRRPISEFSGTSSEQIDDGFYDETYRKSAAFLRMLRYAMNDTVFQQSLVSYLKQNK